MPLVTVAACVYNGRPYFEDALRSLLGQTLTAFEVLVIDDGSTDGSADDARDLGDDRVRVIRQENAGKAAALNVALAEARGRYFAIQDADDLSYPRRLERQATILEENPDLAAVFCGHDLLMGAQAVAPRSRAFDRERCRSLVQAMRMPAQDPTGMFRTDVARAFRFDPEAGMAEGLDFILRVGEEHPLQVLGECLYSYRLNPGSLTRENVERRLGCVRQVFEKACARRGLDEAAAADFLQDPAELGKNRLRDNNLPAHFMESVLDLRDSGERGRALRTGLICSRLHPLDPHYHKALLYGLLPRGWVRGARRPDNG